MQRLNWLQMFSKGLDCEVFSSASWAAKFRRSDMSSGQPRGQTKPWGRVCEPQNSTIHLLDSSDERFLGAGETKHLSQGLKLESLRTQDGSMSKELLNIFMPVLYMTFRAFMSTSSTCCNHVTMHTDCILMCVLQTRGEEPLRYPWMEIVAYLPATSVWEEAGPKCLCVWRKMNDCCAKKMIS